MCLESGAHAKAYVLAAIRPYGSAQPGMEPGGGRGQAQEHTHILPKCKPRPITTRGLGTTDLVVRISCQVPPMYSAIKVKGQKLYNLAREGQTIERWA